MDLNITRHSPLDLKNLHLLFNYLFLRWIFKKRKISLIRVVILLYKNLLLKLLFNQF